MNKLIKLLHLRGIHRKYVLFRVNRCLAGTKEENFEKKRKLLNSLNGIEVGEGTRIVGPIEVWGTLKVGKNCWIGKNLKVNGNGEVIIEENCDIGPEVTFQTGGHEIGDSQHRAGNGMLHKQRVGAGTWIGGRSTILNDAIIGKGCIIAGCSCVVGDVKDNVLVGGVPAKTIRNLKDEHS